MLDDTIEFLGAEAMIDRILDSDLFFRKERKRRSAHKRQSGAGDWPDNPKKQAPDKRSGRSLSPHFDQNLISPQEPESERRVVARKDWLAHFIQSVRGQRGAKFSELLLVALL